MKLLFYVIYFVVLAVPTIIGTLLLNSRMDKHGFKFRKHITMLIMLFTVTTLYLIDGFSLWTVPGHHHPSAVMR